MLENFSFNANTNPAIIKYPNPIKAKSIPNPKAGGKTPSNKTENADIPNVAIVVDAICCGVHGIALLKINFVGIAKWGLLAINELIVSRIIAPAIIVASTCNNVVLSIMIRLIESNNTIKDNKKAIPESIIIIKCAYKNENRRSTPKKKIRKTKTRISINSLKTCPPNQSNPFVVSLYLDSCFVGWCLVIQTHVWSNVIMVNLIAIN
ncbi:MAG: hypothetical protein K8Q88_07975 [Nitrosarchaeum sp.]|nr:hypothetical protein [Nitrosarchaeum sp.]